MTSDQFRLRRNDIEERYQIVFSSQQSYYEIFDAAGLSWKKSQKRNPKTAPELVKKKPKN